MVRAAAAELPRIDLDDALSICLLISEQDSARFEHELRNSGRFGDFTGDWLLDAIGNEFRARDPESDRLEGDYLEIDFAANAASLGARTWHVRSEGELRTALHEARDHAGSCAIVVDVGGNR